MSTARPASDHLPVYFTCISITYVCLTFNSDTLSKVSVYYLNFKLNNYVIMLNVLDTKQAHSLHYSQ